MMRQPIGWRSETTTNMWCKDNNLSLNMIKTKEMIVDYRKCRTEHTPIDGAVVVQVESFKFFGVHITKKQTWSKHSKTVVKRARQNLFPLRRFSMGPQILKGIYSCTIESILNGCITACYGNCSASDRKALQRVVWLMLNMKNAMYRSQIGPLNIKQFHTLKLGRHIGL